MLLGWGGQCPVALQPSLCHVHPSRPALEGVPGAQPNFQGCSGTTGMGVREMVWGWNSFCEAVKPHGLGDSGPGPSPALPHQPRDLGHGTDSTSQDCREDSVRP